MAGRELWQEYWRTRDEKLKQELIIHYLPLVRLVVGRMTVKLPPGMNYEDLEGYGVLGLIEAVDKFNPELGHEFEAFAYRRIRGAVLDELRRASWVPRSLWQKLQLLLKAQENLSCRNENVFRVEELARVAGLNPTEIEELKVHWHRLGRYSLDEMLFTEEGDAVRLGDAIADPDSPDPLEKVLEEDNRSVLARAISALPEKDKLVLALYYQEGLTLKEIGQVLGVSESRVCQLHSRAIKRLRAKLTELIG